MESYYQSFKHSRLGELTIVCSDEALTGVCFGRYHKNNYINKQTDLAIKVQRQLEEYFTGNRTIFDIPIKLSGTEFQKSVWEELVKIPYGETRTYQQIAIAIGNPKACRAVGMANNKNPIAIIIPCHRVIGANRKLVGYGGGLEKKEWLLQLERTFT